MEALRLAEQRRALLAGRASRKPQLRQWEESRQATALVLSLTPAATRALPSLLDALSRASVKRFVPPPLLVGVAGTVTTLAALSLEMDEYEAARVHGHVLSRAEVTRIENALFALSLSQRKSLAGMPAKRADVLPAGAMLLRSVMDHLGADEVLVSDRGIRWGRLFERFGV